VCFLCQTIMMKDLLPKSLLCDFITILRLSETSFESKKYTIKKLLKFFENG
jgi:hypothetical protein